MRCVHDAPPALDFILAIDFRDNLFVIGKEYHISPLFDERGSLIASFAAQLELVAVKSSRLIRQLKFADQAVRRDDDIHTTRIDGGQRLEHLAKFFFDVDVALAVSEILDTAFGVLLADVGFAKPLHPISSVDNERLDCR